jgi:hypothetical protein
VSGSISAPAGFFLNDAVTPTTATDLLTAVATAAANVDNALTSEQNAAASATAAAASATAAAGSSNSVTNSVATATTQATNAAGSATAAASSASAAATSANNASTSANSASTYATNASTSATNAASSATAASNSASAASTSATNASASQAAAANSATAAAASNSAALAPNTGRNKLHNSMFNVAQRGNGPWTTSGSYAADRWILSGALDTFSWSRVTLSDSDRTQIGDEEAFNAIQNTFTGNSGATAYNLVCQRIEGVHRFSNKTLLISFWAKAASGSPAVGVSLTQGFGAGGSPSATVNITGTLVTLSTTWARYQVSIQVPSTAGTTLGTSGGDFTQVNIFFSAGANNSANSGGLGVQSGTVTLWGIQAELDSTLTPLEKPDPYYELATCQRFFQAIPSAQFSLYAVGAGIAPAAMLTFPPMRAAPTIAQSGATFSNATALSFSGIKPASSLTVLTASGAGTASCNVSLTLSADL